VKKEKSGKIQNDDGSFMALLDHYREGEVSPGRIAKSFRINAGLKLDDIAKLTKIPSTNLSKIENGKVQMTSKYAEKIAAVYGVHPATILYPEGYSFESRAYSEILKKANSLRHRINVRKTKEAV
jgi:transcriptional regulator with XRE-family HTH domain